MKFLNLLKKHFSITWYDNRGAVVTHGGVLPDSSQKTDFYALIDNATVNSIVAADISASAGITDSQLATISTAGKVNTSALTGQIANANLAQLTTTALVSGAALTLLSNIPSGAGIIPAANVGGVFGTWASKTIGQIYQALTDGIVVAYGLETSGSVEIQGVSDSSSSPSTIRAYTETVANAFASICFPVKKNDYYEVTSTGFAFTTSAMYFLPLGS